MSRGEVVSVTGKTVGLTDERWLHIERRHPELRGWKERVLDTVEDPNLVVGGRYGELLAVKVVALDWTCEVFGCCVS